MTVHRLKWLTLAAPLAFIAAFVVVERVLPRAFLDSWVGYLLLGGVTLIAVLLFNEVIYGVLDRIQERQAQQNRELLALHEAGLQIAEELDLESVLQRVVDNAAALVGARYGALSLPGEGGGIAQFITTGITPEERARLGSPPVGHGLLGVVLTEGQRLRLDDLTADPRSQGFPPHHPPMRSLLAVPINSRGRILGNLYLTEKDGGFTADDEGTLTRFATQAAVAIGNARLHRLAQESAITTERTRIAREMHDSLAQVLGYVNTKAQAAQELLRQGHADRAAAQIAQLGAAARDAYADVREHILSLRTSLDGGRSFLDALREYLDRWQEQSAIRVVLEARPEDAARALPPSAELQLLRIVQEALSNIRKHANATEARVRIAGAPDGVEVAIADDGVGFDPAALGRAEFPRFGLTGMRERAEAIGATLDLRTAPGQGTTVLVRVPLRVMALGGAAEAAVE